MINKAGNIVAALTIAVVAVASVACATSDLTPDAVPAPVSGWAARSALCAGDFTGEAAGPVMELAAGELLEIASPAELNTEDCVDSATGEPWVKPETGGDTLYVIGTGADRSAVDTTIDTTTAPVTLNVTHTRPGDSCAVTADFRGALIAIISAPTNADTPVVNFEAESAPC